MAFSKYANAVVAQPVADMAVWAKLRSDSPSYKLNKREASIVERWDPQQYLLSHCTIIASVDTENGPGPLGRHLEGSFQVDRRFPDYYITPSTSKYVNNNEDSWERRLLLGTYRTFVGGDNFVEHMQIKELSKGRIIDAVARDLGESVYVDILVATDRKHDPLIRAIQSQRLNTLSMGCTVRYTQCSFCGNVAEDETQMCSHIKYSKGTTFIDAQGRVRKIAELCGHYSDPTSVKFIEASWVGNPAFKGAVVRNILTPEEYKLYAPQVSKVISLPSPTIDLTQMPRAARQIRKLGNPIVRTLITAQDAGIGEEFEGAPAKEPEQDPMQKAVGDLAEALKNKALEKVRREINQEEVAPRSDLDENDNNNLVHQASQDPHWRTLGRVILSRVKDPALSRKILLGLLLFKKGGWNAVKSANSFSGREVLGISRFLDEFQGSKIAGETRVYRTILAVGGVAPYGDSEGFLAACRRILGRELTLSEQDALITKGRLFDLGVS